MPGQYNFTDLFAQYNIKCSNYSIPGASNSQILHAVKQCKETSDLTIVFQTDPTRDLFKPNRYRYELVDNIPVLPTANTLDQYVEQLLNDFYTELNQTLTNRVLLVGGLAKLYHPAIPDSFEYVEPSWSELVDNTFKDCYYEWVNPALLVFNQLNFNWGKSLTSFEPIERSILSKNYLWQNNEHFGHCHPGDLGYLKMFNALLDRVKGT